VATTGIRVIKVGKPLGLKVVNGSGERSRQPCWKLSTGTSC
jgi:hypothetical protein